MSDLTSAHYSVTWTGEKKKGGLLMRILSVLFLLLISASVRAATPPVADVRAQAEKDTDAFMASPQIVNGLKVLSELATAKLGPNRGKQFSDGMSLLIRGSYKAGYGEALSLEARKCEAAMKELQHTVDRDK